MSSPVGKKILGVIDFPYETIKQLASPEGLEMMSAFMGVDLTTSFVGNIMLQTLAKSVGKDVLSTATEMALREGAMVVSNAVLASAISQAVVEGTAAAVQFQAYAFWSAFGGELGVVTMIVQILTSILDSWDLAGYGQELSAETLRYFNKRFNDEFFRRMKTSSSHPEINYFALRPPKDRSKHRIVLLNHTLHYLSKLRFNSVGEKIIRYRPALTPVDTHVASQRAALDLIASNHPASSRRRVFFWWVLMVSLMMAVWVVYGPT